jgi:hypothetical protein
MKGLVDRFVKFAETLPGFGLAFLIATLAYAYLKGTGTELSPKETFVVAFLCWLLYHAAAYLVDKLWDAFYGPNSTFTVWRTDDLNKSRNNAAKALFGPIDPRVTDYASAKLWQHVVDGVKEKSLNRQCSKVATPTDAWRKSIEPTINVSKAARTVFAFAVAGLLVPHVGFLRDWSLLAPYIAKLRPVSVAFLLGLTAIAALLVYVVLRVRHNIELYEHVAAHVTHVRRDDDEAWAVIYDVIVRDRSPKQATPHLPI